MGSLIHRKRKKMLSIFEHNGFDITEDVFIDEFKRMYPEDWLLIQRKWSDEEAVTHPGKKHPMQPPDVYMKEMFRNWSNRYGHNPSNIEK